MNSEQEIFAFLGSPGPRSAREGFDSLGAESWAQRAREELSAAGVPSRPTSPAPCSLLSALPAADEW
jgi:hypothetical protein